MLARQSGITPWREFEERMLDSAEPRQDTEPTKRVRDLSELSRSEREEWRKTGDLATTKLEPTTEKRFVDQDEKPQERHREGIPKQANELTAEEKAHWRKTGDWPLKEPEQQAKPETPRNQPRTDEERRAQHERNHADFDRQIVSDPALKSALDAVQLDTDRGAVVLHTLADIRPDLRRVIAQELARRPDLTAEMVKRGDKGQYIYSREQVRDVLVAMANNFASPQRTTDPQVIAQRNKEVADRVAEMQQTHSDLDPKKMDDAAAKLLAQDVPRAVQQAISGSKVFVDLMHILSGSENFPRFLQLAKSDPMAAVKKIGKVESEIEAEFGKGAKKAATEQKPPLRAPIEIGGRSSSTGDDETNAVARGDYRALKGVWNRQYKQRHG